MDVAQLEALFSEFKANALKALSLEGMDAGWANFWHKRTMETITNANERIKNLANNKMLVYDTAIETKPFWIDIMQTVQKSLWTTNLLNGSTFGYSFNENLLALQKDIIEQKGVTIQRVFVFDPKNREAVNSLATTMTYQLLAKIEVFVIERNIFDNTSKSMGTKINTDDFMIIDDQLIYENIYNDETAAYRNILINEKETLAIKKRIAGEIMKEAQAVNFSNINQFPKIV